MTEARNNNPAETAPLTAELYQSVGAIGLFDFNEDVFGDDLGELAPANTQEVEGTDNSEVYGEVAYIDVEQEAADRAAEEDWREQMLASAQLPEEDTTYRTDAWLRTDEL